MNDDDFNPEDYRRGETKPVFDISSLGPLGPHYAILDPDHNVIPVSDAKEWVKFFGSDMRIVQQNHINQYFISTVFLGVYHGKKLWWFETMVFLDTDEEFHQDRFQRRYTTWDEAKAGHDAMVEIIRYGNF